MKHKALFLLTALLTLIKRNWLLGMRIQHEILQGQRAEYGEQVVKALAKELTAQYGEGFTWRNLYNYIDFYSTYSRFFLKGNGETANVQTILHAVRTKYENIFHALRAKSPIRLSWTHYRIILQENSKEARDWYEQEAAREMWSTRTLQRNVSSQYYHRLLQSQNQEVALMAPLDYSLSIKRVFQNVAEHVGVQPLGCERKVMRLERVSDLC